MQAVRQRKLDKSTPLTGPEAEVRIEPHLRSNAKRNWFSGCAAANLHRLIGQKSGSGGTPAAFWSLFRRGKSDPGPGRKVNAAIGGREGSLGWGGPGAKARSGWLRRRRGKRRLFQLLPQFHQAISQDRGILELQHLRRASPRSAAPRGPRWHFTCAAEVNSALRQGFAPWANRLCGAVAPGKEAAISAPSSIPPGDLSGSRHTRTPASLPPLSSASPCARSPPPPPGG